MAWQDGGNISSTGHPWKVRHFFVHVSIMNSIMSVFLPFHAGF